MRILIADKLGSSGREALAVRGHDVEYHPSLSAEELPAALAEHQPAILVVRSTKVSDASLGASDSLSLVIRAGAGVNTIDLENASRRGIFVANCPGKNAIAVAELSLGLMLALDRQIPNAVADGRAGRWEKKKYGAGGGLHGLSLGLVGFGSIAIEVARRAAAFGMQVQAWTPRLDLARCEAEEVELAGSLDELLSTSDIVSIHVPYRSATQHLIGARELGLMKDGAILLNTARGGVVDDRALLAAVEEGRIRAGLDVLEEEPSGGSAAFDHPLAKAEGVCLTPHIGASTAQATQAIADEVLAIVDDFALRGSVRNGVNVQAERSAAWTLVVRHLDQVGVLAGVLDKLRRERLNVQEMQNVVFQGGLAASATISLEREPSPELLGELRGQEAVLGVDLRLSGSDA